MERVGFERLPGFEADDSAAAFEVFAAFARDWLGGAAPLRPAASAPDALLGVLRAAADVGALNAAQARAFFAAHFEAVHVGAGFLTGYYEPWVEGARERCEGFPAPLFARPADLVTFAPGGGPLDFDAALSGARRKPDGALEPYPPRKAIEAEPREAVVWLADEVEAYLIQVQGCARVQLRDGGWRRLVYDGRNGRPYSSLGRLLIAAGEIPEGEMSLARLKFYLRANGLQPGERARSQMQRNESYVFFRLAEDAGEGPVGGAGRALTPLRSIAVDRTLWSYGTPMFPVATLPWEDEEPSPFRRLMIAEDTGSAIVGRARADLFFGGGEAAGRRAGSIRHAADMFALRPREAA